LQHIIAAEVEKQPDASIVIISDRFAAIGKAVEVMDMCALAGAERVSIAADRE
jgi:biopolymer transport protein ExbD